jgi:hypothetical protein
MSSREYEVVLTPEEEGGYSVTAPALPGCISQFNACCPAPRRSQSASRTSTAAAFSSCSAAVPPASPAGEEGAKARWSCFNALPMPADASLATTQA